LLSRPARRRPAALDCTDGDLGLAARASNLIAFSGNVLTILD